MENATLEPPQLDSLVEIMYLSGERKGEVDRFNSDIISFGRSPDCDVIFQGAALTVSRVHAKIIKKNNQYFLENMGPNGCFVNGNRVQQALISSGDVVKFSASGPKIRFLYRDGPEKSNTQHFRAYPQPPEMELTIQFEANTQTFRQASVILGSGGKSDFILHHAEILDEHAELRVHGHECFIKSLARDNGVLINGRFIHSEYCMENNDIVRLGSDGPRFVYLGEGKLMQQEDKQHPGFSAQSNDEMRTYIIPTKQSFLGNIKSALTGKKEEH